jgi:hypothetical protein
MFSTVYLEAQIKTQDLSTLKWVLRANGILVGSTWHDEAPSEPSQAHLHPLRLRRMRECEALVVVETQTGELGAELALLVGLALGWELKVIWIGAPPAILDQFGSAVTRFDTIEDFRKTVEVPRSAVRAA